jgi:hypothetical protein
MTAGTGTTTKATTFSRVDLLIRQLNLVVKSTTGSTTFETVIDKGIRKRWIECVSIYGVTPEGLRRQEIEIKIDWAEHLLKLKESGQQEVSVNLLEREANWVSRVIGEVIDGFNQIKDTAGLTAMWTVTYTTLGNSTRDVVDRELGLKTAILPAWEDGRIDSIVDQFKPRKLTETLISWRVVTK